MEFLEIRLQQGFCGFIGAASGREDFGAQLIQIDSRDAREALGDPSVPGGRRRGFEHDRVADDGGSHQTCQFGARHQAVFLIHRGDDRRGGTDRLIAHEAGISGLDVA